MVNDVLHQAVKCRNPIDRMDALSADLSGVLMEILPRSYQKYSPSQQEQVRSLLTLWSERNIFAPPLIQQLRLKMVGNTQNIQNIGNAQNTQSIGDHKSATNPVTESYAESKGNVTSPASQPVTQPVAQSVTAPVDPPRAPPPMGFNPMAPPPPHIAMQPPMMPPPPGPPGPPGPPHPVHPPGHPLPMNGMNPPFPWPPMNGISPGMVLPHSVATPFGMGPRMQTMPQLPQNTMHLSIGDVIKLALDLRRTGGGGTYVPLPMDKVPTESIVDKESDQKLRERPQFKRALEEYFKELALIDPARKSSKSSKRLRRSRRRRSRSRSRSSSRSRSRSRSRSSSSRSS